MAYILSQIFLGPFTSEPDGSGGLPAKVMLYEDLSPMTYEDGTFMTYE